MNMKKLAAGGALMAVLGLPSNSSIYVEIDNEAVASTTVSVGRLANTLFSAQKTLENILFYLQNGFGFENLTSDGPSAALSETHAEIINDIADVAFSPSGGGTNGGEISEGFGSIKTGTVAFSRNLNIGDSGPEVKELQRFLNTLGPNTKVASSGAGSPGQESDYFGERTRAAVAAFQEQYANDILAPLGLPNGTGYFGQSTREKANELSENKTATTPNNTSCPEGYGLCPAGPAGYSCTLLDENGTCSIIVL
ncbi:MAG: peptidoglycan-binding domain-containing protein [bacterium]|nr:peptidoglycan-binding domain-containing protein [bacterium]